MIEKILKLPGIDNTVNAEPVLYALGNYATETTLSVYSNHINLETEDYEFIMNVAIEENNIILIQYMLDKNIFDYEQLDDFMEIAIENNRVEIINLIKKYQL